jgi:hypothetical protein
VAATADEQHAAVVDLQPLPGRRERLHRNPRVSREGSALAGARNDRRKMENDSETNPAALQSVRVKVFEK